jgi:hypothetical protein
MKTKQQQLKDIDFYVTIAAICVAGIMLIIQTAAIIYADSEIVWPFLVFAADLVVLAIIKGVLAFYTNRYD